MRWIERPTRRPLAALRLASLVAVCTPAVAQPYLRQQPASPPPAPASAPSALPGNPAADPLVWSQQELSIPYRWTGAVQPGSEVVLYHSADRGRSWRVAGSAAPHVRSFRFTSPGDGEHWFAIRTYDSTGAATPTGPLSPEMRVVVDTAAPQVDRLDARIEAGQLLVELTATDGAGFTAQPAYVYAQAAGQPGWTPIQASAATPSPDGHSVRLTAQWRPPAGATRVEVRATVEDRAGNRVERSATAEAAPAYAAIPARPAPFGSPFGGALTTAPSLDPFADAERRTAVTAPPAASRFASMPPRDARPPSDPVATPWPADAPKTRPLQAGSLAANAGSPFSSASFRRSGDEPFPARDGAGSAMSAPPGRMVNSAEFEFDYELDRTGRWGVAKVELWGTDNGGRSWRRFAIDSDRESPIHVKTPGEGVYGFRLLVESIGGLEAPTPRPGDEPEAVVGVDLTKPQVLLGDARQGVGYFADQLVIEWRAEDERLANGPIDLFYSNRDSGPWIPIATGLPNNGRHSWRLQRHLPRQVYLRVEARDEAGNVGVATSTGALEIDVATASGSLKSVRASGG